MIHDSSLHSSTWATSVKDSALQFETLMLFHKANTMEPKELLAEDHVNSTQTTVGQQGSTRRFADQDPQVKQVKQQCWKDSSMTC